MDFELALITLDRGLEKVMKRISNRVRRRLSVYENCPDFIEDRGINEWGVVVVDGSVCGEPRLMDLQLVVSEVPAWQILYLPRTNKKSEIKQAMSLGAFGCLHKPVSEQEIRQMVKSATGI